MIVETPRGAIKVKARVTPNIVPGVVCVQHGWWQGCKELELPGYDAYDDNGANPPLLIGTDLSRSDQRLTAASIVSMPSPSGTNMSLLRRCKTPNVRIARSEI